MTAPVRVTIWNEYHAEQVVEASKRLYPDGMHQVIADHLANQGFKTRTATLEQPEHGLTEDVLNNTDVLTWWGHLRHADVDSTIVDRVQRRVLGGMGLIVLHSGHESKIFQRLMGTSCDLKWREANEKERVWVTNPGHSITKGLGAFFEIPGEEMYGEPFIVPEPDELVFISWFEGGEVFRSGCCYKRGNGKIFYFRPGHETYPTYYQSEVMQVMTNAVLWAAPSEGASIPGERNHIVPLEPINLG
ncbi:MAG: ThuA domain-containing protein [Anaerolineae bacterium]|nr:ThuA domain-containing protein [Anaerolineae bacterium]